MIGDFLYQLNRLDQAVIQRQLIFLTANTAATTVVIKAPAIPQDKIGLLQHVSGVGVAGGAQTTTEVRLNVEDEGANNILELFRSSIAAPVPTGSLHFGFNHLVLMPREVLELQVFYSAAGVANFAQLSAVILLLPKGTLQLR